MSDAAQIVLLVAACIIGGIFAVRVLVPLPARIRRRRRPEQRVIRVVGVGGGGSNAVDRMVAAKVAGVTFVACNTDAQALRRSRAKTKIRIGEAITRGLGSGGDPDIGRRSAEENEARIAHAVAGTDLVFIVAGLGGGTGSGAAPIVGANARVQGAVTVAVVTKPFAFEGTQRRRIAEAALAELAVNVDSIITIPNDRVADVVADDASMLDAFKVVDDVVLEVVRGITDLLDGTGLINLDFADVRAIMHGAGPALIGLGRASGEGRAVEAARQAVASPLLEASIRGARGILFNVAGPPDLRLNEVRAAADEIRASADPEANVIFGASLSRPAGSPVLITLIATGLAWPEGVEAPAASAASTGTAAPAPPASPPKLETDDRKQPVAVPVEAEDQSAMAVPVAADSAPADEMNLDMPSFLRRGRTE